MLAASNERAETNWLYTMTMLSYLTPDLKIRSATVAASAKVGMSRPIWLKVRARFWARTRESWALLKVGRSDFGTAGVTGHVHVDGAFYREPMPREHSGVSGDRTRIGSRQRVGITPYRETPFTSPRPQTNLHLHLRTFLRSILHLQPHYGSLQFVLAFLSLSISR